MDEPRADALLARSRRKDAHRGRLKVFLGMAPGVGKTYAMLLAGHGKLAEGVDVVAGVIETHGRVETAALRAGMPRLSPKAVEHRGTALEEFDLDAALARRPGLLLVDELAHTNAPGSRHPKRHQDVRELLDAGIDVLTTLNVQHLESQADAVRAVTGVAVRETVPDSVLDAADEIELIDLTPDQLRQRLAAGSVYPGEGRARAAADNFFSEANLAVLRQLALGVTADRARREVREARALADPANARPWRTRERLLVAVSPAPSSDRLVRHTRRLAAAMDAPWVALHVETGRALADADRARLAAHLDLARRLGAEVVSAASPDVAAAILDTARREGATQIVVGKPGGTNPWARFRRERALNLLVRRAGPVDVSVVRDESPDDPARPAAPPPRERWDLRAYSVAAAVAAGMALACWPLQGLIGPRAVSLVFLFGVVVSALFLARGPVLLLGVLSALAWDFLFLPPHFTLYVAELPDALTMALYLVVALVLGELTGRLRAREEAERAREARATALYRLTRALSAAPDLAGALRGAAEELERLFEARVTFLLPDASGALAAGSHPDGDEPATPKELGVARWAFDHGQVAGQGTDTLPDTPALYVPLRTARGTGGVLGMRARPGRALLFAERELLETAAGLVAAAVERDGLLRQARHAELAEASERLQRALLDSVSHELKTPLAVISTASEHLLSTLVRRPEETRARLLSEIRQASLRLERTVNNLLDMSRLEAGRLPVKREWCDVLDSLRAAVDSAHEVAPDHRIEMSVPADMPPLRLDAALVETALVNLLLNAASHAGDAPRPAELSAAFAAGRLRLAVRDHGPGLPPGGAALLFGKFQRGPDAMPGGLGLGLSIVQRLAAALGGSVSARDAEGGGAEFIIELPAEAAGEIPA